MSKLTPQANLVLDYLKSGRSLTRVIADHTLGVAAVPRRIADLKKAGHNIKTETKRDHMGKRYSSYTLEADPT